MYVLQQQGKHIHMWYNNDVQVQCISMCYNNNGNMYFIKMMWMVTKNINIYWSGSMVVHTWLLVTTGT